ncbi:permease [Succinivibrio sp.]|uniref:permease n=1 Tax=Succinivibrio sp. TaxID=2053619 RepID=UPI0038709084
MTEFFNSFESVFLKLEWLNGFIEYLLCLLNIDKKSAFGSALNFFFYDVIKISIFLLVLIFTISYIQSYFPPHKTKDIISKFKGIKANILAALLGTVTPFCSCSSIPLFIGFTAAGVRTGVTFSFLISSPMVDLGSLVILSSVFGFKIAAIYVVFGIVIAVLGGMFIQRMNMDRYIENFIKNAAFNSSEFAKPTQIDRLVYSKNQMLSTYKKTIVYIMAGVAIGAFIHNCIPENLVSDILGGSNPFSVILSTIVGIPMYADIFGTIPIAEALLAKGASLGTVLSFMMAVTTLSLPSMLMLKKAIKMPLLAMFVAICTLGIIISGYLFNAIELYLL